MVTQSRSPALSEVLRGAIGHATAGLRVCMPGRVEVYSSATQTANVKPVVQASYAADGGEVVDDLPVLVDVPVVFPRAGAWHLHLPLSAGDHVVLVFTDRSLDRWRTLGGVQDPQDLRAHDLSDAIAFPASLVPDSDIMTGLPDHLRLGGTAGTIHVKANGTIALGSENPTDSAATALKVQAQLTALATALAVLSADMTALGSAVGVGAATAAALTTLLATPFPGDVASTKVKVDP